MHFEDWSRETHKDQVAQAFKLVRIRPREALEMCERLANQGSPTAMVYAGIICRDGLGRPEDRNEAEKWFRMAADAGLIVGYYYLGCLYWHTSRFKEASEAFAIAGAKDYGPALNMLGRMYLWGHGVEKNVHRAKQYLARASAEGHLRGRIGLARLMMKYPDTPFDKIRGLLLYLGSWASVIVAVSREGVSSERFL